MANCIAPERIKTKGEFHTVPCGKCNFCLQNRRHDWSFRLYQELQERPSAHFITLTYADEFVPIRENHWQGESYLALNKNDLWLFHKSIRQSQKRVLLSIRKSQKLNRERYKELKEKWKIRYYSVGEYGSNTQRPHYHSIMFGLHPNTVDKLLEDKIWGRGFVKVGFVTCASIAYVTKYVIEKDEAQAGRERPFTVMSRRPGIGNGYLKEKAKWHKELGDHKDDYRYYVIFQGKKQRMPRYYKDKIFGEFDKWYQQQKVLEEQFTKYWEEIERLAEFTDDPISYYEQTRQQHHDSIRIKSKSLNTF